MNTSNSPRILISRMSALGDTILTLPVACALRERFPRAFLGWVVEKKSSCVVRDHECLDEVIVLERGWFANPRSILEVRRRLRPLGFEIAVDCQSITKSSLAAWLSGARTRIGFGGQHGCELSPWLNNVLVRPRQPHLTDRSLGLLAPLGIDRPPVRWKYPIAAAARERVSRLLSRLGLTGDFAIINPGAAWGSKRWEMDRYAAVAVRLGTESRLPTVVVWGSEGERGWARQIVEQAEGHAILAPPTNLEDLAALAARARIFLSSDTGPMHMAVAVGTPSLSLHGVTHPEESGPHGPYNRALQVRHEQLSRRRRKRVDNKLMRLITVDIVFEQCLALLEQTAGRKQPYAA